MTDDVTFNPDAADGDGDGMVQDGTEFERPVGTMPEGFNPDATDGDGDGMVQDGTEFERPAEPAVEETSDVIKADEPVESEPAITNVADGVIGTGIKSAPKPKKAPAKKATTTEPEKVAIFASRNLVWPGVGKIKKGYNFVSKEDAEKWDSLDSVRIAEPNEIKANLG